MTEATVYAGKIVGDAATGSVLVRFASVDSLEWFIDLLNANDIRTNGDRMTFLVEQDRPGEPVSIWGRIGSGDVGEESR